MENNILSMHTKKPKSRFKILNLTWINSWYFIQNSSPQRASFPWILSLLSLDKTTKLLDIRREEGEKEWQQNNMSLPSTLPSSSSFLLPFILSSCSSFSSFLFFYLSFSFFLSSVRSLSSSLYWLTKCLGNGLGISFKLPKVVLSRYQ